MVGKSQVREPETYPLTRGSYRAMLGRCGPSGVYTKLGIGVCEAWRWSFEYFLADMGPRPSARHSLERMDPRGDYEPDNCMWSTPKDQATHKRATRPLMDRINVRHEPAVVGRFSFRPSGLQTVSIGWLVIGPW